MKDEDRLTIAEETKLNLIAIDNLPDTVKCSN